MKKPPALEITYKKGVKLSWKLFKTILKGSGYEHYLDLRRSTKDNIPLLIKTDCCGDRLEIRRKKDFPIEDRACKCGDLHLVKWTEV